MKERLFKQRSPLQRWLLCLFALSLLLIASKYMIFSNDVSYVTHEGSEAKFLFSLYKSSNPITDISQMSAVTENLNKQTKSWFNLGFNNAAIIRIDMVATSISPHEQYRLFISRNNIFTPATLHYKVGSEHRTLPLHSVSSDNKLLATPIPEEAMLQPFFVQVQGAFLRGQIYIFNAPEFTEYVRRTSLFGGMYYGVLVMAVLLSVVVFSTTKDTAYLSYGLMLISLAGWLASGEGWLAMLISSPQDLPFFTANALGLVFFIALASFSKHYLQLKVVCSGCFRLLGGSQLLLATLWVVFCLSYEQAESSVYQVFYGLALAACFLILLSAFFGAFKSIKLGRKQAVYYVMAISVFLLSCLLSGLSMTAILDWYVKWTLIKVGSLIEMSLLSIGFIYWHKQVLQERKSLDEELDTMRAQLQISESDLASLKSNMHARLISHAISPHIAKVLALLPNTLCIKANGNYATVFCTKGKQLEEVFVDCRLQNIADALGEERVVRCHKSYLILPNNIGKLVRRSSADYDLVVDTMHIPVGRKYLGAVKQLFAGKA